MILLLVVLGILILLGLALSLRIVTQYQQGVLFRLLVLIGLLLSLRIVKQYEEGVLFRLGRVVGVKKPGLNRIVPVIDVLRGCRCAWSRCRSSPRASSPRTT